MKKYIFLCLILFTNTALTKDLVLIPVDEFLGEIPDIKICNFRYGPETIFDNNTRITINPYTQKYGPKSVVKTGDGMTCSSCFVSRLEMSSNGITTLYCSVSDDSLVTEIRF